MPKPPPEIDLHPSDWTVDRSELRAARNLSGRPEMGVREISEEPSLLLRAMQLAIIAGFVFSNIYFEWHANGLAIFVIGGLVAYHSTRVILAIQGKLPPFPRP